MGSQEEIVKKCERSTMGSPHAANCTNNSMSVTPPIQDKSIQVDMDHVQGEDPKKNLKYWQDLAGLRGAREQYLSLDARDLVAENNRQADYINCLKYKLELANEEIWKLKTKRCRCQIEENDLAQLLVNKQFSSMGL